MKKIIILIILITTSIKLTLAVTSLAPFPQPMIPNSTGSINADTYNTGVNPNYTFPNSSDRYICTGAIGNLTLTFFGIPNARWYQVDPNNSQLPLSIQATYPLVNANANFTTPVTVNYLAPPLYNTTNVTFTQPGLYLFFAIGKNTSDIWDTVSIRVIASPVGNGGPNIYSCDLADQPYASQGYDYMATLNADAITNPNETGSWVLNAQQSTYMTFSNPTSPTSNVYLNYNGSPGVFNVRWRVTNTLTGCYSDDIVSVVFYMQQNAYAPNRSICNNHTFYRNSLPQGVDASYPGYGLLPWNGVGAAPTFYWQVVCTDAGSPLPTVTYPSQGFAISTTVAGLFHFDYIIHGPCGNSTYSFTVNFATATSITQASNQYFTNCNSVTQILNATMTAPGPGETCSWGATGGLVFSNPNSNVTDISNINPNQSYNINYYIYSASNPSCYTTAVYVIRRKLVPFLNTSFPANLPCGTTNAVIHHWGTDPTNNNSILYDNVITYNPATLISCPNPANPPTFTSVQGNTIISNLSLPGAYVFQVSLTGNCGDVVSQLITINVNQPADAPSGGSPITLPCNVYTTPIIASATVVGNGSWLDLAYSDNGNLTIGDYITNPSQLTIINPNVTIGTLTYPQTPGSYIFDWAVSNPNCGQGIPYHGYSTVIVPNPNITTADAGADVNVCKWEDIILNANASNGATGYWTSTNNNIVFSSPNSPTTTITSGISASTNVQTFTFTWHVSNGCSTNLSDNVLVTINPAICCQAGNDIAYTHIPDATVYNTNKVLSGKLFVEGIITVDAAVIDITNVDMVFDACAGIRFINGATVRANNSVFRACGLLDSWLGFDFEIGSVGIIEASSFKNAIHAINALGGYIDVKLINNNFINCKNSIASNSSVLNAIISGNNFTVDQSMVNFGSCNAQNNNDYFGIVATSTTFVSGISQNNFVYSANTPANSVYGVFLEASSAVVNANTFSNLYRTIDANRGGNLELTNNVIEISGWQTTTQHTIRITENGETAIKGNTIKYDINNREPLQPLTNSAIYAENNRLGIEISDNTIQNFETGLQLLGNDLVYVTYNKILNCKNYGIYSDGNMLNASCNEIDMATITDRKKSVIGIAHLFTGASGNVELYRKASLRSNCISECTTSIYLFAHYNCLPFDAIYNNFLFNYADFGIYAENIRLQVGTSQQFGGNSFVSNNYHLPNTSFAQAIDLGAVNCSIQAYGNFGILNVSGTVEVTNDNEYHSTATCAKQITYKPNNNAFNSNQQFTTLEMCNEYDVKTMSIFGKSANSKTLNNNWNEMFEAMPISNRYSSAYSILNAVSKNELDVTFNRLKSIAYENNNDVLFLEVAYFMQKNDLTLASQKLSAINTSNNDETDLKAIIQIELDLMLAKNGWSEINQTQQNTLITIDAKKSVNSTTARDLLQAANGKNDYRFTSTKQLTTKTEGKVVNLSNSNLLIYPNPASNNLTLELVNASDDNATINIFDALGQRIYQARANIKAGKLSIDISPLSQGIYHVQLLSANNKSLSNSFIKQ